VVSDDTIERVCQEEGERAGRWMSESNEPVRRSRRHVATRSSAPMA